MSMFETVETESTSQWKSLRLHITKWVPQNPRALLYISHGVAEHMGRYLQLAEYLASNGILVFGHDHVGHGKSEGDRCHIENYQQYVDDVIHTVESTKTLFPDLPCFLMGHSMGGLVAGLTVVQRSDLFEAIVLSSAFVEIDPKAAGWFIQTVAKVVAMVAPQLGIKKVDPNGISSIPEEVQAYMDDPLNYHGAVKAQWATASTKAIEEVRQQLKDIKLPLLLIHGTEDHLIPISASEFIAESAGSSEISFEKFPESRHEVFHDREQAKARKIVLEWIASKYT